MASISAWAVLEGKTTTVDRMLGKEEAENIIEKCMKKYEEKFG